MNARLWSLVAAKLMLGIAFVATSSFANETTEAPRDHSLYATIAALDFEVFSAFNQCSDPAQLKKHASFFDPSIEFYHDTGGVTWNRQQMLANTKKNVCGHYTRELIQSSLKVYPIKDFGAISQGSHRFCRVPDGPCEGLADFTIVWRHVGGTWKITRVLSYGHRANDSELTQ